MNLGTVKANTLYIEGKNVTVLNTNKVTDASGTALRGSIGGVGTKAKVQIRTSTMRGRSQGKTRLTALWDR